MAYPNYTAWNFSHLPHSEKITMFADIFPSIPILPTEFDLLDLLALKDPWIKRLIYYNYGNDFTTALAAFNEHPNNMISILRTATNVFFTHLLRDQCRMLIGVNAWMRYLTWLENKDTGLLSDDSGFGGVYTLYKAAVQTTLESRSWLEFCKRMGIFCSEVGVPSVTDDPLQNVAKLQRYVPTYLIIAREKALQQISDASSNVDISQHNLEMKLEKSGVGIYSQEESNATRALRPIQGCLPDLGEHGSRGKKIRTGMAYWKYVWETAWKKPSFSKAVISPFPATQSEF